MKEFVYNNAAGVQALVLLKMELLYMQFSRILSIAEEHFLLASYFNGSFRDLLLQTT